MRCLDYPGEDVRALIVDDDEHLRELLRAVAETQGLEVTTCEDAESGWDAFLAAQHELVILDWMLPGMDGLELCRRMRQHPFGQRVEILIVTARRGPTDLQAVLDADANDYIAKPVDPNVLGARIAIAVRGAQNQLARSKAESALMDTERRLSAAVAASPVTIFALNRSGECIVSTGEVLREVLGLEGDLVGGDLVELLADHSEARAAVNAALAGKRGRATLEVGSRVAELRLTPSMTTVGEAGVTGVVTEVTERVQMSRTLERTVQRVERANVDFVAVLDQLRAGTMIVRPDGRIRFVSRAAAEFFRVNREDATGELWEKALPLTDSDRQSMRDLSSRPEESRSAHLRVLRSDGSTCALRVEGFDDPREDGLAIWVFYDETEVHDLRRLLDDRHDFHDLVGRSDGMLAVYDQIRDFAGVSWTVLVEGATGTGKELVARAIHSESPRAGKPFVAVNCAGLSVTLLQSQLFGHRKGAFTGAHKDQPGFFEAANGGTLFLDEIGDISRDLQVSLLRVLEEGEITRIGESQPRRVDVRVICATHRDLVEEVQRGNFRADLMYRIRVARVSLPPLRTRREDIPLLVNRFLERARAATGKTVDGVTDACLAALVAHDWPGNVRELRSAIDFGAMRTKTPRIDVSDLPPEFHAPTNGTVELAQLDPEDETKRFADALAEAGGNRSKAARILGISRATFYRKLDVLGVDR